MNYSPEHKQAWDKAIKLIEDNLIPISFNTWIKPLKLYSVTPETIIIIADNFLTLNHVKQRYYTDLYNMIKLSFGRSYELEFYTQEEISRQQSTIKRTTLNNKYNFENFVVGPSNSFAYAASLAVAEQPSDVYNPLFIYGSVGLGKTHLMNAIGNYIMAEDPMKNVLLTSSESFTNELIDSIVKKKDTSELRNRMRNVDVLMVDDIQFLSKTKATQEEFFHTFNDLYSKGKQIIISSDRPPKDIPTIEERLRSRFEWGLIVDIQKPDYETRVAILRRKADEEGIDVPYDVIDYIAERVESNIRELEGTLTRLNAQCQLMGMPLTLDCVRDSLSQLVKSPEGRRITPELIISVIADQYGVTSEDILSKKRSRDIALPRQIAMYLCRNMTQLSTTNIGRSFGGRDHTTVMHGCEKINQEMNDNFSFRKRVEELTSIIKNG
ncbi:MAG: chromosomal replication initiator protein DnaA [Clostridia bacterium]|nr:chromosomal replication initiator protein DnaA [Clostridia bacterium]